MDLKVEEFSIPGVLLLRPEIFRDHRGYFLETHRARLISSALGEHVEFVQGNVSSSVPNCIRGLHYQLHEPQGKLVRCLRGSILDVAVDLRQGSPTFGKHVVAQLDDQLACAIYVPPGFAHGFLSGSQGAMVQYECTTEYVDAWSRAIRWDDPDLRIPWGIKQGLTPVLSNKDRGAPTFGEAWKAGDVFQYHAKAAGFDKGFDVEALQELRKASP